MTENVIPLSTIPVKFITLSIYQKLNIRDHFRLYSFMSKIMLFILSFVPDTKGLAV